MAEITAVDILRGLRRLGLDRDSTIVVHSSLRSFGHVAGGARTVVEALADVCGTVVMPASTWDLTGVPAPPGLVRPDNAYWNADSWADFDAAVAAATPYRQDLPVDRWIGRIPHSLVHDFPSRRGPHPLMSFAALGERQDAVIAGQTVTDPLGPLRIVHELDGFVLQLGVGHTTNTTIHLAEQTLGRSCFYRYARGADGLWVELPNVSGESHEFGRIEPDLAPHMRVTEIGSCQARLFRTADIMSAVTRRVEDDPQALLCGDAECRCGAAYQQRLAWLQAH